MEPPALAARPPPLQPRARMWHLKAGNPEDRACPSTSTTAKAAIDASVCSCGPSRRPVTRDVRAAAADSSPASCPGSPPPSLKTPDSKPPPTPPSSETSTRTTLPALRASSSAWERRWGRTSATISRPPWTRPPGRIAETWGIRAVRQATRMPEGPMPEGPMKIEPLAGFEALDESRWNALLDRAQHPSLFLTWQWQTAWTRAFLGGRPLQLLTVSDDAGALPGLLPLYAAGAGVRRFIGGDYVSHYLPLVVPPRLDEEGLAPLLPHP